MAPPAAGRARRRHKRVVFIRDVLVHGMGHSRSSDLSHGGMFLETMTNVGLGSEFDISFRVFPNDPHVVSARVRVVYEHPQVGAGLMFIALSAEAQAAIDSFVAESPESDGGP
jgi:c-di-GMP-binding flagellar brake protein YcgR